METCSLILIPKIENPSKVDETMKFAKLAGIKFIELRHAKKRNKLSFTIKGFQGAMVVVNGSPNGNPFMAKYTVHPHTGEAQAYGNGLVFEPEQYTRVLQAWMPDTPFNRDVMAKNWHTPTGVRACFPADPDIDEELRQLAIEKGYDNVEITSPAVVLKKSKQTIADLIKENQELKEKAVQQALLDASSDSFAKKEATLKAKYIVQVEKECAPWLEALEKRSPKGTDIRRTPAYNGKVMNKVAALLKEEMSIGV